MTLPQIDLDVETHVLLAKSHCIGWWCSKCNHAHMGKNKDATECMGCGDPGPGDGLCSWKWDGVSCTSKAAEQWDRRDDGPDVEMLAKRLLFCHDHGVQGTERHDSMDGPDEHAILRNFEVTEL